MSTGNRTAGKTITKRDVVERIAEKTGLKKTDVKATLQEFLDEIIADLGEGNRLEFRDFGVFEVRERKARTAQNPKTLEPVTVPAKFAVKFKPGRRMKEALDGIGDGHGGDEGDGGNSPASIGIEPKPTLPGALAGTPNGQV